MASQPTAALRAFGRLYAGWALSQDFYRAGLHLTALGAPDLGRAMKRWCRHHGLLTEDIALSLTVQDGTATLAIEERRDLGALREFCLVSVLRNAHGLACWFIASRLPLVEAAFPFAAPPHADVYPVLFPGGALLFERGPAQLRFDLAPVAWVFRKGHRIRIVLAGVATDRRGRTGITPAISTFCGTPPFASSRRPPRR